MSSHPDKAPGILGRKRPAMEVFASGLEVQAVTDTLAKCERSVEELAGG